MKMDSSILSPFYGDPRDSTSISVSISLSEDTSGGLTEIVKVGEYSGTVDKHSERFRSATINSGFFDSY